MDRTLLKENFYRAVNKEWLAKTKIPNNRPSIGTFVEIHLKNEKRVEKLADELEQKFVNNKLTDPILQNFAKFYQLTTNATKRDELGVTPLLPYLEELKQLDSLEDYWSKYSHLALNGFNAILNFSVYADFANSQNQILYVEPATIILPEISYYKDDHPQKKVLLRAYDKGAKKILAQLGFSPEEIRALLKGTHKFDENLAAYYPSGLELSDYSKMYNPLTLKEFNKFSKNVKLSTLVQELTGKDVKIVSPTYPRFFENLDKVVNRRNWNQFKSWLIVTTALDFAKYADDATRVTATQFGRVVSGVKRPKAPKKVATDLAVSFFSMPVGMAFVDKYFSNKIKKDVEKKVATMIEIYAQRLQNNTWLSPATKEKALLKLRTLDVQIGYPKEFRPFYKDFKVSSYAEGGNLLANVIELAKVRMKWSFSCIDTPVNKNFWGMAPNVVNAYYSPVFNQIVFPAAILNEPFYSTKQSSAANYGGIGAVIAHEISHAFDNHGAQFDEKGNLNMWWTQADFDTFTELGKKMIDLFDGVETFGGKCDGKLTLSENIADAGGISCALAASKLDPDHSSEDFFISWATIWRQLMTENAAKVLLVTDPHASTELRANMQLKNLDEFYETFDIKEGDKMFLPKEKRVTIW
ncbi:M13-type metalloendopeptidase [Mycoplasmopsis columbinasalis]|uniref:Neutral endopeptidase n=1 Tax=Mycoplasmopsis columbinasalis TaxID=114880 RepID=A0A449BAM2_9BACT|nr:M13 family metallopeptidase [Mycoplasmopsis columbinasalis]VEU78220.1 Neutral endopeptidase [Mycoplasmopsis columbinasalis]